MSLELILGGSGSGKSRTLYHDLIEASIDQEEENFFVIVPEQFTMETQKEIVRMHPRKGVMNIDIVSFQRLAYRIFEELCMETPEVLDDMGKSMILRKVAAGKSKELGVFAGHLHKLGFISQLKSVLSEFYQYEVSQEQIESIKEQLNHRGLLYEKLKDLEVVYQGFQDYLKDTYITTEEILDVLCRVIPNSNLIKNSTITLDGYTGFTPIQYRLIRLFMRYARKVSVTVTIDPRELANPKAELHNLFYLSKKTLEKLNYLAREENVGKLPDRILEGRVLPRFQNSPALGYLEQNFNRFHSRPYAERTEEISVHSCKNPSMEAGYIAAEIFRLVREEGCRYRDIAVITGDVAGYRNAIAEKFARDQIPYFLDDKRSILGNPLVEVMRGAILIVEENFSYESVFRYLKTGFPDILAEDVDILENYVVALGIRGRKRWTQTWERVYRTGGELNLDHINEVRERVLEPLLPLWDAFKAKGATVKDYTRALFYLIAGLGGEEKLKRYQQEFEDNRDFSRAKEFDQAYELVLELLDRLVNLLGDEVISIKEYREILDAGFVEIKVGIIPTCVDQVVVGDIERTRLKDIKALFFIGVNDGIVPSAGDKGGIFSEVERDFLERNQLELAPTAKKNSFIQKFYLYLLLTKPKNKLYLTYSKMSGDGSGRRPSYLISSLLRLFPGISVTDEEEAGVGINRITTEQSAMELLIDDLREHKGLGGSKFWKECYRWFALKPEYEDRIKTILDGIFYRYEEKGISGAVAKVLYGATLSGSVTRLEKYAACAYAHFLSYGLELVKRQEYELATVDFGNIFHDSIDSFFKEFHRRNLNWNTFSEHSRKELVSQCVRQVTEEYGNTILQSSARNKYLTKRLERITDRTIWALGEQIKQGEFVPAGFEVRFSSSDGLHASSISLSEDEMMQLSGRIDRLDLYEDDENIYVKIIDYKSGSTKFDLADLYHGLQMQLVVYMDAAIEMLERSRPDKKIIPAGIFYYNIRDPLIERRDGMDSEEVRTEMLKELRMNGLVNRDEQVLNLLDRDFDKDSKVIPVTRSKRTGEIQKTGSSVADLEQFSSLREYVHHRLSSMGSEILDGYAGVNPYKKGVKTACDYCEYSAVCGFDLKSGGYRYRRLKALKPEEVWAGLVKDSKEEAEDQEDFES